jgi:hypothetical protein
MFSPKDNLFIVWGHHLGANRYGFMMPHRELQLEEEDRELLLRSSAKMGAKQPKGHWQGVLEFIHATSGFPTLGPLGFAVILNQSGPEVSCLF